MIKFIKTNQIIVTFFILFFSVFLIPSRSIYAFVLTSPTSSGLVGYWTFDTPNTNWTNNTLIDVSGHGQTGTMFNMTQSGSTINGKLLQGLLFDGSSSYISLSSNPITTMSNPSSICTWAYTSDITNFPVGWDQAFLNFRTDANNGLIMGSITNTGNLYVSYRSGGSYHGAQSSSPVFVNNTWVHVCYVWNGNGVDIYANGNSVATSTNTYTTSSGFTIGAVDAFGQGNWIGGIDDLRIYNRALTLAEVRRIYLQKGNAILQSVQNSKAGTISSGLVGYWTFDGKDVVGGVALDKSGNGNNGKLINIATSTFYTQGKIGQGFRFDGVNDYVKINSDPIGTGADTFSAWIYPRSYGEGGVGYLANNGYFLLYTASGISGLRLKSDGSTVASVTVSLLNKWSYVTVVRDASGLATFYINGVQTGIANQNSGTPAAGTLIYLGSLAGGGTFDGTIDDVRIYNRALSQAEITQLYNIGAATKLSVSSTNSTTNGLVGYWTFDGKDVVGGVALDKSGNGNNGKLINIATSTFYTQGKIGQGFKFDGSNDTVNAGTGANITGAVTISAWVKTVSTISGKVITMRGGVLGTPSTEQYALYFSGNTIPRISVSNGTTRLISVGATNSAPNDVWNHIVGTYNGTDTTKLYINGVQVDTDTTAGFGSLNSTAAGIGIGGWASGAAGWLNGTIDDVRIYNRALSQAEITQLYNLGR